MIFSVCFCLFQHNIFSFLSLPGARACSALHNQKRFDSKSNLVMCQLQLSSGAVAMPSRCQRWPPSISDGCRDGLRHFEPKAPYQC